MPRPYYPQLNPSTHRRSQSSGNGKAAAKDELAFAVLKSRPNMEVTDSSLIWAASNLSLMVGAHNALSCQGDGRLEGFSIVIAQAQPEASLATMFHAMMQKEAIF